MKKIVSIFLLIIYSSTSFAVTMDFHYCSGKYSGISFSNFDKAAICGCDQNKLNQRGCCSDKTICAKTDNHKMVQQYWVSPNFSDFIMPVYFINMSVTYPQAVSLNSHYSSSGFIRSHFPSYLTFICTYRI